MTIAGLAGLVMTLLGWLFNFGSLLGGIQHVFSAL